MNKKLISLLLCVVLLLSFTLASCGTQRGEDTNGDGVIDDRDKEVEGVRGPMTLVWALIAEEIPSEKTELAIENAVNKITESRYTTHIDLQYFTEDEYKDVIEARLRFRGEEKEKREEAFKVWKRFLKSNRVVKYEDGSTYKVETEKLFEMFWESYPEYETYVQPEETTGEGYTQTEAETVLNEWGIGVLAYPKAEENQVDIIYLSGYNDYTRYITNEWIASLNEALSEDASVLSDYIFPAFLTAAETMYGTYAIPNNNTIGDYTYLLLHKELIEKYYYVAEHITGLTTELCQDFLYDVANSETENFVPLLDNEATRKVQNIKYWGLSYTEEDGEITSQKYGNFFSIIGSTYSKGVTQAKDGNSFYQCSVLLNDSNYTSQLKVLKDYEYNGYYGAGAAETRTFAAGIVVGDLTDLVPKYSEDYHMIVIDYPRGTEEDLFRNMWAVSAYCKDVNRAMEIITYLNTNVDFRNLIQYGIQDVHYTVNYETGIAERLNNDYKMDINKTGNVFLAYPEVGMNPDAWTYGKLQNQNAKVDLCIGFSITDPEETMLNVNGMNSIIAWSTMLEIAIDAAKSSDDINLVLNGFTLEAGTDINALSDVHKVLLAVNEITDANSAKTVKGFATLIKEDEYVALMTNGNYEPQDEYYRDPVTNEVIENRDYYGYGDSLHKVYRDWARDMKFLSEKGT